MNRCEQSYSNLICYVLLISLGGCPFFSRKMEEEENWEEGRCVRLREEEGKTTVVGMSYIREG